MFQSDGLVFVGVLLNVVTRGHLRYFSLFQAGWTADPVKGWCDAMHVLTGRIPKIWATAAFRK
jgi:hypothetical protein